jgi:cyclic 2,3-diphosphoglycerate synthase
VDGEHYPPVVRAAIEHISSRIPGCVVIGAALLGGREKLARDGTFDVGVPLVDGRSPEDAMSAAMARFAPELVLDLSDQPVVDLRVRMSLVTVALLHGVPYQGADFRFDPPPRPRVATKPSVAVIGTGKRTGKTAVSAHLARLLAARGTPPVIVAMGRGGPAAPELVDPATFDLSPKGLVELALSGRHAASDHLEDALTAGVVTIGTRRCGGGMAGAPADSTFAAGVALANSRPEGLLVLEGSGQAIPPVHADSTICVVPATGLAALTDGLGSYRLLRHHRGCVRHRSHGGPPRARARVHGRRHVGPPGPPPEVGGGPGAGGRSRGRARRAQGGGGRPRREVRPRARSRGRLL